MGSWGREDVWQGCNYSTWQFHICEQINWEEQLGNEIDYATQSSSVGKESLKTSVKKPLWEWWRW